MINPTDDGNLKMSYPANLYSNKLTPRKDKEEDLKDKSPQDKKLADINA